MPALTRDGFTLAELVVALAIFGILSSSAIGLLRRTQDAYRAESQEIDVRQNLRAAAAILPAELRELDAVDGDVVGMARTAITIRAPRQLAVVCRPPRLGGPPAPVVLTLAEVPFYGSRDFNPTTDSLWIYYKGAGTRDGDGWILGSIASLDPDTCPDGRPGRRVTTMLLAAGVDRDGVIPSGAPALGFETVTYRLYRSSEDGRWYVGMQTASDFQPVLGPVTSDGLAFAYFDSSGATTPQPSRVSLIEARVRGRTAQPIRRADGRLDSPSDSLVTLVYLRNNRRF